MHNSTARKNQYICKYKHYMHITPSVSRISPQCIVYLGYHLTLCKNHYICKYKHFMHITPSLSRISPHCI